MTKNKLLTFWILISLITACNDDDVPEAENDEELITRVELLFAPQEGAPFTVSADDPDGEGPESIVPSGSIILKPNTAYELFIDFENGINGEDIDEEVKEEAEEHMLFFSFTEGLFESPAGNGNVDNRTDQVNYIDRDSTNLPLGLITSWKTGTTGDGSFRIILKHQPGIKSSTSTAGDGETDIDISWDIEIKP